MRTRVAMALLAAAVVLGLVAANRHALLRASIQEGARLATGLDVRIGDVRVARDGAAFYDLRVSRGSLPVLSAARVAIRYSPRDLLPGSAHRMGILGLDLVGVRLTLTRFPDGSFTLSLPKGSPVIPHATRINPVPWRLHVTVRDAQLELREPSAYDPSAKVIRAGGIDADADVDTAAVTRYRVRGAFEQQSREPFTIAGTVDALRGYAIHHAHATRFPLPGLANYFAQTPQVRILQATAENFDARVYALGVAPNVDPSYHVSLGVDVRDGRLALAALDAPIERLRGRLELVDDTFYVSRADAMLAGIPLRITGGGYDLTGALTGGAQLRLGVEGSGDLSGLRRAFAFARDQAISGRAHVGVLVHGPIGDPVIVARVNAPHTFYRSMPFDALDAGVVYHSNVVALAPLRARYAGVAIGVRGTLGIGPHVLSRFALHVAGPASRLPYLDEMLGDEPIAIDASAVGRDLLFGVEGSAASARGVRRVAALFAMNPDGTASVEPFWLHTERGDFDGAYALDRPHDSSAFWLVARNLRMRAPSLPTFPGLSLPAMPPIDGRAVGMTLAGGGSGSHVSMAGSVGGSDTTISGVRFDRLAATFGGTLQSTAINSLRASGPWGEFAGDGLFSTQRFVAYGAYRGTFEGLQPFLGSAIVAHGALRGTVGVAIEPQRIVVQGTDLAMQRATLRGVPVTHANLTLAVEGDRLRILSAEARAAGGEIVAAGNFSLAAPQTGGANPGALSLVANRLSAKQLSGIGLPLTAGTLSATGNLAAGAALPRFDGGVTIGAGRVANFSIAGDGSVNLSGDSVALRRVVGAFGGANARIDGSIGSLQSGAPSYDLDADVPAARVAPALRQFGIPNYKTDGTFNAQLHIAGRSARPRITGHVGVPAGEINGLPFIDGSVLLAADPSGVSVRRGSVLVGTTAAGFSAVARPNQSAIDLRAPHATLSDFNNFFDTGDTLAGRGAVKLAAASQGGRVTSSGDLDVRGFRYRNLPIGDTRAVWSSARNAVTGALAVGGSEGMLRARGTIALSPQADWQSTLTRSRFDLRGDVGNLDLSLWMPALGMQSVPITGRVSGDATIRGRFPLLDVRANAHVRDGTLGPLTLDSASVALHAAGRRIVVDRAELTTPEIAASAAGSFGLRRNDPLDIHVHAATDRLAKLVYDVSRVRVPISGSFESTLSIAGTYRAPTFLAGVDGTGVRAYGISIASLFGEFRLQRHALVLSNAGATLGRGEVTLAGALPLSLAPLRLPPDQPMSFDLDVVGLDPAVFDETLGQNTKMSGLIDGHIGLSGTVRRPSIVGRLSLARGSYFSALERVPITQLAAALSFNRVSGSIDRLSARLGSGTAQLSGRVAFPNGFSGGTSSLHFAGVARGAQLDLPAYGSGTLDARLTLDKKSGTAALLAGDATLSNATLPFATFVKAAQGASSPGLPPLPLAFDLRATAGKNVRVRGSGYGAGLDIGVSGSVNLGGSLSSPTLDGTFASTGGTLTYFDRAFRVQQGGVRFNAADGVLPTLHAVASSTVVNPDPDRARNPYGSADITITVDGPIAGLKIGLTSNPPGYTRDEILGLIAPFGGFVNGIAFSRQSMLAPRQPSGITPLGALSPIPNVDLAQRSTITVGQEAFNILNAQFAASLLGPVESTIGQGLGLSSVNLTLGYYGNVGFTATRLLGKAVSAVYAVTFGVPQVQSFGLMVQPNPVTSATLNFFYQSGPTKLLQLPTSPVGYNASYTVAQPLIGNSGFSLTVQRYFW
ncbi:MAG: translocation/assembly module TamB domain-containing protein [Candidatus Eremiobacteraeota bacterium]|nr:translocation/assembly module TamB domain-containing protein [Candidatus Eremiobacteraeota bacterium]